MLLRPYRRSRPPPGGATSREVACIRREGGSWRKHPFPPRSDESLCIRRHEAYALGGGRSARDGLLAALADGEDGAGAVAAAPQRREDVARVAVQPDPQHALHRLGLRAALGLLE